MAKGVIEVTGRIEVRVVGDRLLATVPSGEKSTTYAIRFHLAERAAREAMRALGEKPEACVVRLPRKAPPLPQG